MNPFAVIALIAFIALAIKAIVLSKVVTRTNLNSDFVVLALSLIALNATEFSTAFVLIYNSDKVLFVLYPMLCCLLIFPVAMLRLVTTVTQFRFSGAIVMAAAVYCIVLIALLFSGSLITGSYELTSYAVVSAPAEHYYLFQLYIVFVLGAPLIMLIRGAMTGEPTVARRSRITLTAIAPICLVGLATIALKTAGYNATTAVSMPIVTTLFLWMLMLDEREEFVTLQIKWRILWRMARQMKDLNMNSWAQVLEASMVEEAMKSEEFNMSAAAKLTGTSKTTFYRKATLHGLGASPGKHGRSGPVPSRVVKNLT